MRTGGLLGATGVLVDGKFYDVDFVDGTCPDVFGVCDEAHFAFTTASTALAASKALLDQVLLDGPLGNFDSNPMLTNGCFVTTSCWALTPYAIFGGSNFLVTQTANLPGTHPDGYSVHQPFGPGLPFSYNSSDDENGVLARWSAALPIQVTIDIIPGKDPNIIKLFSHFVPVAILTTATFDAADVDPSTVILAGASVRMRGNGAITSQLKDVDHDGDKDLIVKVFTEQMALTGGETELELLGSTFGGMMIQGTDTIQIVP